MKKTNVNGYTGYLLFVYLFINSVFIPLFLYKFFSIPFLYPEITFLLIFIFNAIIGIVLYIIYRLEFSALKKIADETLNDAKSD